MVEEVYEDFLTKYGYFIGIILILIGLSGFLGIW